jgi:hypothetical protein
MADPSGMTFAGADNKKARLRARTSQALAAPVRSSG